MPISKINPNSLAANSVTSAAIANGAIAISGVTDLQTTLDAKLDDTDVGVSVQAYDADTAKLDVAQSFTAVQTMGKALQETKVAIAASEIDLALEQLLHQDNLWCYDFYNQPMLHQAELSLPLCLS
jgi:hypothetical protein